VDNLPSETIIRLACFLGVLVLMALAEWCAPRRTTTTDQPARWFNNLALVMLNSVVVRIALPMGAVGVALIAEAHGWGVFNMLQLPIWLAALLTVILLDFVIYLQHVLFHAVPVLWRLHRVHHADLDFDVTTGLRFHTIEIVISMSIKIAFVTVLGAPAIGVLIFEVLLNATAMFNHSNVRLPGWLDAVVRLIFVTPDMHRVHHSADPRETNSNYGFNLAWWDYLLGTYLAQPALGHDGMTIGLEDFRDEQQAERIGAMLAMPFLPSASHGDVGQAPPVRS